MSINVKLKTKKKQNSTAKNFNIKDLKVHLKKNKWNYYYVNAVYYKGTRLKRYTKCSRFIYKIDDCIIKIEEECRYQTNGEIKFYKKLRKANKIDKKYFPKLIASDSKRGIIVQEFIKLGFNRKAKHRDIVERLIKDYKIKSDVHSYANYNWAINKKNNLPVIYDLGFA